MSLTFLGKDSKPDESPTLYATEQDTYIVQGWIVTDPEVLAKLVVPEGEAIVEVPKGLFKHLINDGVRGTITSWRPPIVFVTEEGNLIIQGSLVSSAEVREQMDIPDHEDCVEVPKSSLRALLSGG
ncbi:hypothetical protein [Sinosporangium siamense]|uniref:Uncharacterized protein n=1 Tax=Sinosporangium siamense TaxID=1367973 RepID=A0A919REY1_9ACTN|nr:hypothetical protein [Sinosporangium siamense]GII90626.1 hypothetical protein Ssi02_08570 [Sinosporangium siamense]